MIRFWMNKDHIQLFISPLRVPISQEALYVSLAVASMDSPYLKKKCFKGRAYEIKIFSDITISDSLLEKGFII